MSRIGGAISVVQCMQNLNQHTTIRGRRLGGLIPEIAKMFLMVTLYLIII